MLATAETFYKQNGYYIARDLLTKQIQNLTDTLLEIDTIITQQLNQFAARQKTTPTTDLKTIYKHFEELLGLNKDTYVASLRLCANLTSVHALLMDQRITNTIKTLGITLPVLQATPVLHVLGERVKIPGGYYGIDVHQDWPSLQGSLDTVIVWIPFMDVDQHNYPVELLPGSHLGGLYPGKISEHLYEVDPTVYKETDFIPAELARGDVLFMSGFTLHKSSLKASNGFRIACSTRYDNAQEPTYIERAYPFAQKRVVTRDFLHPNFPTTDQIKDIFSQ